MWDVKCEDYNIKHWSASFHQKKCDGEKFFLLLSLPIYHSPGECKIIVKKVRNVEEV
jgi:hypothetical protein